METKSYGMMAWAYAAWMAYVLLRPPFSPPLAVILDLAAAAAVLLVVLRYYAIPWEAIGWRFTGRELLLGLGAGLAAFGSSYLAGLTMSRMLHYPLIDPAPTLAGLGPRQETWLARANVVLFKPWEEEFVFRAGYFNVCSLYYGPRNALWMATFLFSASHLLQIHRFAPLFVMGFCFTWVYHRSRSLTAPLLAHCLVNAFATIIDAGWWPKPLQGDRAFVAVLAACALLGLALCAKVPVIDPQGPKLA